MALFQNLIDFFESIFLSSKPEVKVKLEIKKIETEIKSFKPEIYKNGMATPNLAESLHVLYTESLVILQILQNTVNSEDAHISNHYTDLLIKTGYTGESQLRLAKLNYENRKEAIIASTNEHKAYEEQQKILESLLRSLQTPDFKKIEQVLCQIDRLYDICRFNYITAIHLFDKDFEPSNTSSTPNFKSIDISLLESTFMDLYYLIGNYEITNSQARAVLVLAEQKNGQALDDETQRNILSAFKKMSSVFTKILNPLNLLNFLKIIKKDPNLTLQTCTFNQNKLENFADRLQGQFSAIEERIQTEIQDKKISLDIKQLFDDRPLITVIGYNSENNIYFQDNSFPSLIWITPVQVLKSFLTYYFNQSIQTLLNSIVVEGFFTNPTYKSDFSSKVYACTESINHISHFEQQFDKSQEFDLALLRSYAKEGHKNTDLAKKLVQAIDNLNITAQKLLTVEVTAIKGLYDVIDALLSEAHKVKTEDITNIKMLFSSTRNRDNVELLEKQFPQWHFFLEIMKNYVIINEAE